MNSIFVCYSESSFSDIFENANMNNVLYNQNGTFTSEGDVVLKSNGSTPQSNNNKAVANNVLANINTDAKMKGVLLDSTKDKSTQE